MVGSLPCSVGIPASVRYASRVADVREMRVIPNAPLRASRLEKIQAHRGVQNEHRASVRQSNVFPGLARPRDVVLEARGTSS